MSTNKLNKTGLSHVWTRVFSLIKLLTGDVDVSGKGTLQEQIENVEKTLSKAVISGKQTTTSTADGGSNVYTFTDVSGNTSTITVKNGSKGSTGAAGAKGDKGDTGAAGAKGATGATGATGQRGSRWNTGTAITGTSTTATVFSGSGITDALVNDQYLNTGTGNTYRCTVAGAASVAKWVYTGNIKGAKGDTGAAGAKGDKGDTGAAGAKGATGATGATGQRGSRWNTGTAITGTSTTATVFSGSGITDALVNDQYLNTGTGNTYRCTVAGAASAAKWVYTGNIKGAKGDTGAAGAKGDKGDTGAAGATGQRGTRWTVGQAITGISTTDTVYATGITDSLVNDHYLNSQTGNMYRCTKSGNAATATWVYVGNLSKVDLTAVNEAIASNTEALANGTVRFSVVDGKLYYQYYTEEV